MPAFIGWLLGGIAASLGTWVGRVLVSLGISYVTYTGVDVLLSSTKGSALDGLAALAATSPVAAAFVGALQVGTCVNILFSAYVARVAVRGLSGGTLTRMVNKS